MSPNKLQVETKGLYIYPVRVYYEDTDATGRVYHANYLKFAERARTEMLRGLQIEQSQLKSGSGIFFVVFRCRVAYLSPAVLDDDLAVHSRLIDIKRARIMFDQGIWRQQECITKLEIEIACVNNKGKPTRIPDCVLSKLSGYTG